MVDACLMHPGGRRLLPDVCGCPVSGIVPVDVCLEGDVLHLTSLADHMFFFQTFGV